MTNCKASSKTFCSQVDHFCISAANLTDNSDLRATIWLKFLTSVKRRFCTILSCYFTGPIISTAPYLLFTELLDWILYLYPVFLIAPGF